MKKIKHEYLMNVKSGNKKIFKGIYSREWSRYK